MEDKLVLQGGHIYNVTVASKLRVVNDIFNTRANQFHGIYTLSQLFYRAVLYSAKRGVEIACRLSVCLSVCDVGGS